jgi:hypothetical protein
MSLKVESGGAVTPSASWGEVAFGCNRRACRFGLSASGLGQLVHGLIAALVCLSASQPGSHSYAQAVDVTLTLDTNRIEVGQTTILSVFAQVVPGKRSGADRVFAWYIDLLNSSAAVAQADFSRLLKSASDNDPSLSSAGITSGANRIGICDTFLNRAGAGVSAPVLLLSVPVKGIAAGKNTFSVRAGTGLPALTNDFVVAPLGGPFNSGKITLTNNAASSFYRIQAQRAP